MHHEASLQLDGLPGRWQMLPDHYREVIMLRHLEGLPFAQVAERMGRSVESVEEALGSEPLAQPDCARRWEKRHERKAFSYASA